MRGLVKLFLGLREACSEHSALHDTPGRLANHIDRRCVLYRIYSCVMDALEARAALWRGAFCRSAH